MSVRFKKKNTMEITSAMLYAYLSLHLQLYFEWEQVK